MVPRLITAARFFCFCTNPPQIHADPPGRTRQAGGMDDHLLENQRLTWELVGLLVQELGSWHAADMLKSAAGEIRQTGDLLVTHDPEGFAKT